MINSFTRERGMRECRSGSMHDRSAVDGNRLPGDQLTGVRHEPVNGADEIRWRQGSRNRLVQLDGIERLLGLLGEEFAGPLGQHRALRENHCPIRGCLLCPDLQTSTCSAIAIAPSTSMPQIASSALDLGMTEK